MNEFPIFRETMPRFLHLSLNRKYIHPRLRRSITLQAQASNGNNYPSTIAATLTEKNIKTGTQRSISFTSNGSSTLSPPPPSQSAPASIKSFFLPQGWPSSVTEDYLNYQIYSFPCHIFGWMSHSLAGSSMLKALGIGVGPAGAVGFSAAIKWVTKDGVGAAGRLFVGGKLSAVFDEDPKRWRMIAEAVTSLGLALEIATQLFPANFVTLAGAGTLAKATGRGMGRPCFRVVQTHFAAKNNVGDVSAKEEVWEVTAQMTGLAASVALLSFLEATRTPEAVVPIWAAIHSIHVALRYAAMKQLRFPFPNFKRGTALVHRFISSRGKEILTVEEANKEEKMLQGPEYGPDGLQCVLGCSIEELLGSIEPPLNNTYHRELSGGRGEDDVLKILIELYEKERYILTWRDGVAYVVLWESADAVDMLRALWQAAWLHNGIHKMKGAEGESGKESIGVVVFEKLEESLRIMQSEFPELENGANKVGWELERGVYPTGSFCLSQGQGALEETEA